ncbi:MAG: Ig-like domain-containing protein [Bacteroidales bacterium]|nr:Ig-like domain-containing protein [Bacteroidales bacterium]
MKRVFYALMFLLVMSLAGCQKEPETIKVSAVVLNSTSLSLIEGETATLSATVTPSNAENKTVHWSTSNSDVATVNNGTVTAVRSGVATITVTSDDGGKTATCQVEVKAKEIPVESVSLDKTEVELTEGDELTLTATVKPDNASNKDVEWCSSDEKVASVKDGKVTAVKAGTAKITVKTVDGGMTAECAVTVKEKLYPVESVSLDKTEVELTEGDELTLTATVKPDNATNKSIVWSSSDEEIATVKDGKVTAIKAGTAIITVKTDDGGKTAECAVTVKAKPLAQNLSISFHNQSGTYGISIYIGKQYYYTASISPSNADVDLEWTIDNPEIATLSPESDTYCSFYTTGFGKAKITLTDRKSGLSASDEIETCVTNFSFTENTGVESFGYPKITVAINDSYQLHWTCNPYILEGLFYNLAALKMKELRGNVYTIVDEPSVISIDANGVITGVKTGTIIISPANNHGIYKNDDSGVFVEVVKGYSETEPNNDFPYANEIQKGKSLDFSLSSTSDVDVFCFNNPAISYGAQNITINLKYAGDNYSGTSRAIRWECYNGSFTLIGSGTVALSNNGSEFTTHTFLNTNKGYLKFYYPDNWKSTPEGLPRGTFTVSVRSIE